jgi:hypothetical protein
MMTSMVGSGDGVRFKRVILNKYDHLLGETGQFGVFPPSVGSIALVWVCIKIISWFLYITKSSYGGVIGVWWRKNPLVWPWNTCRQDP